MSKTATVSITLTVTAEVPMSWTADDLFDKVTGAIEESVRATTKRVTVTDGAINEFCSGYNHQKG